MSDLPAALSFLGIQDPFEEAAVAVLPVPYDLTTTYQPGARFGPRALLTASLNVELYDEEVRWDASRVGVHTLAPVEPVATGPQAMIPNIADAIRSLFHAGKFPVILSKPPFFGTPRTGCLQSHYEVHVPAARRKRQVLLGARNGWPSPSLTLCVGGCLK